ncbi:hypothetical protein F5148DRAFT_106882 [Russula earlei]|uniref:Uncharacterized protein n=1 Tax=Russula earlei TaxID=71964 RepID=A0ACC0U724_9AGAM|nr:hypothetical protein F5148DRAFT_106882 [Russula earlei]
MTATATFLDLPTEVIILIVCLLPLREVAACKRLCRRIRSLIQDSQLLQYHFRTMCSGVEDLFLPGIGSHEFLKSLVQWEMAWQKFDIGERFARHRYQNVLWTVEHIVQNGHIVAMRLVDSSWLTTPGWSYADISRVLLRGGESPQALSWTDIQLDTSISPKAYVLDVNQDLVAMVYYRDAMWRRIEIQFLRFSTGRPHDLARGAALDLELNCRSPSDCEIAMEVMGPFLIMVVINRTRLRLSGRHQKIYFVEWKEGRMRCVRRVRDGTYFPVVAFVSKDLIILARKRDFSFEVCEISQGDDCSTSILRTVCILRLPSLHPSTRVRFHMRNRTPFASNSSTPALRSNRLPFRSSPADALLGFEVSVRRHSRPGSENRRLAFWVHHNTFRKYAAEAAKHPRISLFSKSSRGLRGLASRLVNGISYAFSTPPVLHWVEWGPTSTRWRECSDDLRDRQTLAGMRCAVVNHGSLTLMDFSPGRLALLLAQHSQENAKLKVVVSPTKIKAGRCFLRDFTSQLPYCESTKEEIRNRVLMDDEWILQFEEGLFGWEGYIDFHSILPIDNACESSANILSLSSL